MCAECGAADATCEGRFNECLAKEFEDAGYGRVHNLTVSTYMLQHSSKLTREGWLYERELSGDFLTSNKSPEQIRKEKKGVLESGKRTFKIKSRDGKPVIPRTAWTKTILNVRMENADVYCEDVTGWAKATLANSKKIAI